MPCYFNAVPRAPAHRYHQLSPFFARASPFGDFANSVQPFLRLIDDELSQVANTQRHHIRSFQPRFGVSEKEDAYHLQGELPGIDQQDINIEFKDENTLVVSGRTVREHKGKGKAEESAPAADAAAAEEAESATAKDDASETGSNYHKPTVEDEFVEVPKAGAEDAQESSAPATDEVAAAKAAEAPAKADPQSRYWVNERSVGQFHRSFTFPGHIDQDAVTASLKNGILSIVVPKAAQKEPRKINIE